MKIAKIISKNFKVLLRSKSSALVVIFGPLLLILLVGLSFSNSGKFTLNVGVYSPEYNDLTNSYIKKIADSNENYKVKNFNSETECIDNIKKTAVHVCIIFPQNFKIENGKTNEIKFYIDQSKQNFVYAVVNTVESSFSERSNELSLDMTTKIVNVVTRSKMNIEDTNSKNIPAISGAADAITKRSKVMQDRLSSNTVDTTTVSTGSGNLDKKGDALRATITNQYAVATGLLTLANNITDAGNFDALVNNKTKDAWKSDLKAYDTSKGLLYKAWNDSVAAKNDFVNGTNELKASVGTLVKGIEDSKAVQDQVVSDLKNGLDSDVSNVKKEITATSDALNKVINDINTLQVTSANNIVAPVVTSVETVVPEKTHLDYLFPSLIVLLIMMMSILLSSTLIIMEKNSKAYFRNFTTPTNDLVFVFSTFLTSLIIILMQIIIVLAISGFVFHTSFSVGYLNLFGMILIISSLFVLIGMMIGYLFNTEQTGMMGAISVSSIFLLMSDLIVPMENMPLYIQKFAQYNPFVMCSEALKKMIIFSISITSLKNELILLGSIILSLFVLIIVIEKFTKIQFFKRFTLYRKKIIERPENVKEIFRLNGELVKSQKELYIFIKSLRRKEFKSLVYRRTNRVADFAYEILGDKELAEKVSGLKTRWGILKAIEKHNLISKDVEKAPKDK